MNKNKGYIALFLTVFVLYSGTCRSRGRFSMRERRLGQKPVMGLMGYIAPNYPDLIGTMNTFALATEEGFTEFIAWLDENSTFVSLEDPEGEGQNDIILKTYDVSRYDIVPSTFSGNKLIKKEAFLEIYYGRIVEDSMFVDHEGVECRTISNDVLRVSLQGQSYGVIGIRLLKPLTGIRSFLGSLRGFEFNLYDLMLLTYDKNKTIGYEFS